MSTFSLVCQPIIHPSLHFLPIYGEKERIMEQIKGSKKYDCLQLKEKQILIDTVQ